MKCLQRRIFALIFGLACLWGCGEPAGIDYDKYLQKAEDGLVRRKEDNSPFSGEAYMSVCEECSEPLLRHWPVHNVGQYQNGLMHGTFWFPKSGKQDDFFEYGDKESQIRVEYRNGVRSNENP